MRLIPPYQTVISAADKGKYGTVVARQSAFLSRLAQGTSFEFVSNLCLDCPHPNLGTSLRQVLMEIKSTVYSEFPVFHSIDCTWRSDSNITFTFLPENESDARMYIAGLVPYLRDTQDSWFLKVFTEEARATHQNSVWDLIAKQVSSTTDVWVSNALALDDELNFTDTPTSTWFPTQAQFDIPEVAARGETPAMYRDQDSVSTSTPIEVDKLYPDSMLQQMKPRRIIHLRDKSKITKRCIIPLSILLKHDTKMLKFTRSMLVPL
jgi:hypothetical protein